MSDESSLVTSVGVIMCLILTLCFAVFSAEHSYGMGSEMKPVVIKIPSVGAWMNKPIVRRQVLSSSTFFCLVSPI